MGGTQATPTAGNRHGPDENTARRTTGGLCDTVLQPSRPGAADLPTLGLATGRPCIPIRHPTDGRASPPALTQERQLIATHQPYYPNFQLWTRIDFVEARACWHHSRVTAEVRGLYER